MNRYMDAFVAKTDKENIEIGLPLWLHLADTGGVIAKLVDEWVPDATIEACEMTREEFGNTALVCAYLHDIGKATSYFQSIITKNCPEKRLELNQLGFQIHDVYLHQGETPHAWAGYWIIKTGLEACDVPGSIADIVAAHHGKPIEKITVNNEPDLLKKAPVNFYGTEDDLDTIDIWEKCWKEYLEFAKEGSGIQDFSKLPDISVKAEVLITGLLIVADWIASNTQFFPLVPFCDFSELDMSICEERVQNGWDKLRFPEIWCSEVHRMNEEIFQERFGFLPNEIQLGMMKAVNECSEPGIFILEAPMGMGKTEAALSAAEITAGRKSSSGVFFGMPTQTTSNGLFDRLYSWASNVSPETKNVIRLAHGAAELNEDYQKLRFRGNANVNELESDGMEVHPWFQGTKRALLADFVIGTVDQFLMASLKRKHFMLRHLGLAGKVVIIDECHAYDAYMNVYLSKSIEWMAAYGVPVILLSATLPSEKRKDFVECYVKAYNKYHLGNKKLSEETKKELHSLKEGYPILTWTDGISIKQAEIPYASTERKVILDTLSSNEELVEMLQRELCQDGCAGIIVNTVKKAQEVYEVVKNGMSGYEVVLYHAQYTMTDRAKKEKRILKKLGKRSTPKDRRRVILIGTQVLEQSLDYDVDLMVTELCPIDLLLQRIGRLQRHNRIRPVEKAYCYILKDGENIFNPGTGKVYGDYLLRKTLQVLSEQIFLPKDISPLIQRVYKETVEDHKIEGYSDYCTMRKNQESKAKKYLLPEPPKNTSFSKANMDGFLDVEEKTSDKYVECSVRDAIPSVEVLLMKRESLDVIGFVNTGIHTKLSPWDIPDGKTAMQMARERIRLPYVFGIGDAINKTIDELEESNKKYLSQWQQSPWLQGELVLMLDENNNAELCGYHISYSEEAGLSYSKSVEGK